MKDKLTILVALIIMCSVGIIAGVVIASNKYEDEIDNLQKQLNEKQTHINNLSDYINEHDCKECDCGWYEDFYYEFAEEVGAFE